MNKLFTNLLLAAAYAFPSLGAENKPYDGPDLTRCVKSNFPKEARPYVTKAVVNVLIRVTETGLVESAEVIDISLIRVIDKKNAGKVIPMFRQAGTEALLNRKCPVFRVDGEPRKYKIEVPLLYEIE